MVDSLIEEYLSDIDGQLSDKSRVTDQLLDLRLASEGRPTVVAEVDLLLGNVPGLTTVENNWWKAALERLQAAAAAVATA